MWEQSFNILLFNKKTDIATYLPIDLYYCMKRGEVKLCSYQFFKLNFFGVKYVHW